MTQIETSERRVSIRFGAVAAIAGLFFIGSVLSIKYVSTPAAEPMPTRPQKENAFKNIQVEGRSVIVVDAKTGAVLYERNADEQLPLASITKIMLVDVVKDFLPEDSHVRISEKASVRGEGGAPYVDDEWRAGDLIAFTLITSSNVGAEALADAADPYIRNAYLEAPVDSSATVWLMNARALQRGLKATYFKNPTGLDISPSEAGAYGSAADIAKVFETIASNSSAFASTAFTARRFTSLSGRTYRAQNTDDALPHIPGLMFGKTGFTDLAGGNLAVAYDADIGHPIVAVVLGSTKAGRFTDIQRLVAAAQITVTEQ